MTPFIPLPLDKARCHPTVADVCCKQCRRWGDHPEQTWGLSDAKHGFQGYTPAFTCHGSDSESCRYTPINPEK